VNCIACGTPGSRVIDSRCPDGKVVHRKRECVSCFARWRTLEKMRKGSLKGPHARLDRDPNAADAIRPRQRFWILKRDQYTCMYCGRKAPDVVLHVDHKVPRAMGGGNDPDNLITACESCNLGKGASTP